MTDEVAWELESPACSSCLPAYAVGAWRVRWAGRGRPCEERFNEAAPGLRACGPYQRGRREEPIMPWVGTGEAAVTHGHVCSLDDIQFWAKFRHDRDWSC